MVNKTTIYAAIIVIVVILGSSLGTYYLTLPPPPKKLDKIIFSLPFTPAGSYMPFYVGMDKGFYEEYGIMITILPSTGSANAASRLDTGVVDFALLDISTLFQGISQGQKIKAIGLWSENNEGCVAVRKDLGITNPKQLEGRKLASQPGAMAYVLWPAFVRATGIDTNKVEVALISTGPADSMMLNKQVDGLILASMRVAVYQDAGMAVDVLMYYDYGINTYGFCLATRNSIIANNPDLVGRFVKATQKAVDYSIKNQEAGVDTLMKYNPELKRSIEWLRWKLSYEKGKIVPTTTFDPKIMKSSLDVVVQYLQIKPVPVEDTYTNDFVK